MKTELELKSGYLIVMVSPRQMKFLALSLIARLGETGSVRVLDAGNCFDAYFLARKVRGVPDVLKRISIARAFTCHQVLSLLESTPADETPFVVLDLLRTFYDEAISLGERRRVLGQCVAQLSRMAGSSATRVAEAADGGMKPPRLGRGLVTIYPPSVPNEEVFQMCETVRAAAAEYMVIEPAPLEPVPLRLF